MCQGCDNEGYDSFVMQTTERTPLLAHQRHVSFWISNRWPWDWRALRSKWCSLIRLKSRAFRTLCLLRLSPLLVGIITKYIKKYACIYIYIVSWFLSFLYPGFILMILNECGSHLFVLATLNGVRRTTACFLEDFQAWLGGDQLPVGDNFTAHLMEFRRTADKGGSQPVPQNGRRSEISEGTFSDMFYSLDLWKPPPIVCNDLQVLPAALFDWLSVRSIPWRCHWFRSELPEGRSTLQKPRVFFCLPREGSVSGKLRRFSGAYPPSP